MKVPFTTIVFEILLFKGRSVCRGGSRTAVTSKVELFVIIVNGRKPLTIITKSSTLDVAAALDPPLVWSLAQLVTESERVKFSVKNKKNQC